MNGTNTFSNNSAIRYGSAIYVYYATMKGYGTVLVKNGYALSESVAFISSHGHFSGKFVLLNNIGSLFVFDSNLKITRNITISNNIPSSKGFETSIPEGGGITAFMSTITLKGVANIQQNCAANGGGILASTSKLKLWGHFSFLRNSASDTGGTMYLQQSELNIKGYALLTENTANKKGGAIHAIGSSLSLILVRKSPLYASKLHIRANTADRGGGIYFEWNSKIYVMSRQEQNVYFENNVADFGSAIYVNDSTSIGTCATIQNRCAIEASQSRCFFQKGTPSQLTIIHKVFNFTNNVARKSGRVLYGGLLDRCTVTVNRYMYGTMDIKYAEQEGAFDYIRGYSTSNPVRICFCRSNDVVDCSYTPPNVKVMLGYTFSLSLVAVDQMNRTTNANVCAYLNNTTHRLGENQREQVTTTTCSSLTYNVYSFENISHGMLYFYAVGPCRNLGISMQSVTIDFLPCKCPIGFAIDSFNRDKCYCNCDPTLKPYITKCNFSTQSVIRDGDFWIDTSTSFNETQFVVYPHCPLDYCLPASSKIQLNLSSPNAADAQCAFGRVGKLCGICKRGFTLSLGSSQCLECPEYWPVLTVVIALSFIIGGILLATMILACNLTVATGSINALIFYANVIYANKSIFMPFRQPNLHTIFIHWMNLNFGLDACFIKGMDSYLKTWLNLAFPIYILFIIFTIILLSKISTRFAAIIGRKNPVATLATLLLLCYTNLLQVIITAVSYAVLDYHDHVEIVWLEDATIEYISVKHIPLLIIVCLIWIFGLAYTILLTFWQCLTKLSERKGFKWVKNTKLILFMETYHAPYRSKNRYWTGLLLFVRVSLYASAAANSSKVPKINLMLTIILTAFLLTLATTQIYKKFWLNILEVVVYFNIIVFSVAMFYLEDTGREKDKTAVCYSSVTISFIIFIAILVYHLKMVCSQAYRHVLHNFFAIRSMRLNPQIACRDQSVTHSIVGISRSSSYGGKS